MRRDGAVLAVVGAAAGLLSALFGVGGGTVIVPLLIFWFGFGERLATGTSLAAIVIVGLLGAIAQGGIYGNVHVVTALLLAIPAVAEMDFSGDWAPRFYEDQPERGPGLSW